MLEKIMDLVKGQVTKAVDKEPGIPEEKKEETVHTTTSSIVEGLKNYATPEHLSSLTSLLGGGDRSAAGGEQAPAVTQGLESTVVSNLVSKVGLQPGIAQSIAASVIPAVMSLFSKKVNDDKEPGFNIGSLIGSLTGGGAGAATNSGGAGGIMNMLGGLIGKRR